ncbi:arylsulfatase [Allorhodopirellula solitaria]|uniref:Arylsulfatase n=1 Tax=Allorhodopirellula solitaria TaxID=2527987 RepID=A0A5C5YEL2_9BACT|nr:arylsulfatase [Allorhodopirellula solitaria]TWT72921.1 Arylsulfatase precursor [Allorhodopirellula solitaria]
MTVRHLLPAILLSLVTTSVAQAADKPNILVIFGDDIGQSNISAYTKGLVGYQTPNIDSIANNGMIFTDYYAEQSCTAGRSTFITGQCTYRTGMSKVGLPGSDVGLQAEDPTIAQLLKPLGYATGQFGKNHLGDLDKFLPTNHGFDEFLGNLYHLNAEEEPENRNYPKDPEFAKKFGPRGVIKSSADGKIEDTGPLTKKRMETVDEETASAAMDFMDRQVKAEKPFFVWYNSTRMHFRTHVKDSHRDEPGLTSRTEYADGMIEHDALVGTILKKLEDLKVDDNTIVIYTTDNGPHKNTWPDAANSPFRNEKASNWEGAFRVPCMIRWPGKIEAGSVSNEIVSGLDWLPTLVSAAGNPDVKEQLLKGHEADGKTFKVHLDGYNILPYLTGEADESPRNSFFYFNDDTQLVGIRFENWKMVFLEQRARGTLRIWSEPFTPLRLPKMFDLRADPYESADVTSNTYYDWLLDHAFLIVPAQQYAGAFLETFKDFPPRQPPASFNLEGVMEKLSQAATQ